MSRYRSNELTRAIQAVVLINTTRGGDATPMRLEFVPDTTKPYSMLCLVRWTKAGRLEVYARNPYDREEMIMFYAGYEWLRYGDTYYLDDEWRNAFDAIDNPPVVTTRIYPFLEGVGDRFIPHPTGEKLPHHSTKKKRP